MKVVVELEVSVVAVQAENMKARGRPNEMISGCVRRHPNPATEVVTISSAFHFRLSSLFSYTQARRRLSMLYVPWQGVVKWAIKVIKKKGLNGVDACVSLGRKGN